MDMIIFFIGYITIGFLTYGWNFAYWQRNYPPIASKCYKEHKKDSIFFGFCWPISIPAMALGHFITKQIQETDTKFKLFQGFKFK